MQLVVFFSLLTAVAAHFHKIINRGVHILSIEKESLLQLLLLYAATFRADGCTDVAHLQPFNA